jgi:hypothetical protein
VPQVWNQLDTFNWREKPNRVKNTRRIWRFRQFKVSSRHTHYEKHKHTRLLLQRMLDAELIFSFIFGDGIK